MEAKLILDICRKLVSSLRFTNGIGFGVMQLITEADQLTKVMMRMNANQMHDVFKEWSERVHDRYLIKIIRGVLAYKNQDDKPLGEFFRTNWAGRTGSTFLITYNV